MARQGSVGTQEDVVVVGTRPHPLRDAYHLVLRMSWAALLATIAGVFLVLNLAFALVYLATGGVTGATPGSLRDAFFFSVQTMGTIGYGAMYPTTPLANTIMTVESVVGLIMTALVTGVVFARFSQGTGQLVFSDKVVISPMNGVPTLAFRVGNDRASMVFEARVHASIIRTEKTDEGMTFYRLIDLPLKRSHSMALARSWTVLHPINAESPLFGATPESCKTTEMELVISVVGTDDTSLQPVHGRTRYLAEEIVWGARLADVLSELPDGRVQLDVRQFDKIIPTKPTETFPYPTPATPSQKAPTTPGPSPASNPSSDK
jgi:inward rectifier potassium channel